MNKGGLSLAEADQLRPGAGKSTASFQDQVFVCQHARMVISAMQLLQVKKERMSEELFACGSVLQ